MVGDGEGLSIIYNASQQIAGRRERKRKRMGRKSGVITEDRIRGDAVATECPEWQTTQI